jgi:MFS family permease
MAPAAEESFLATRRGKAVLALLRAVAFLDFVDASIVNVALPSIRTDLGFSEQSLQWVPSAYLLTYGGFMLLGGRAADLLGRRRILVAGTSVSTPAKAGARASGSSQSPIATSASAAKLFPDQADSSSGHGVPPGERISTSQALHGRADARLAREGAA